VRSSVRPHCAAFSEAKERYQSGTGPTCPKELSAAFAPATDLAHEIREARDGKRLQRQLGKVNLQISNGLRFVPLSKTATELLIGALVKTLTYNANFLEMNRKDYRHNQAALASKPLPTKYLFRVGLTTKAPWTVLSI